MKAILILSFFISQVAHAGFSGDWRGQGWFIFGLGQPKSSCPAAEVWLTQSSTQFDIYQGHFDCAESLSDANDLRMDILNGQLYVSGQPVGTIDEDSFHVQYPLGNGDYVEYDGVLSNGVLQLNEVQVAVGFRDDQAAFTLSKCESNGSECSPSPVNRESIEGRLNQKMTAKE